MNSDFDIQMNRRRQALRGASCPLTDEQWARMTRRAAESSVMEPAPSVRPLWPRLRRYVPAAAASVALLVVGIGQLQASPRPASVAYGGQSVRFICNNHCDAQNAIAYLDNYIVKNSAT